MQEELLCVSLYLLIISCLLGECDAKISKCNSSFDECRGAHMPVILSLKMGVEREFPAENLKVFFCRLSNIHNKA